MSVPHTNREFTRRGLLIGALSIPAALALALSSRSAAVPFPGDKTPQAMALASQDVPPTSTALIGVL